MVQLGWMTPSCWADWKYCWTTEIDVNAFHQKPSCDQRCIPLHPLNHCCNAATGMQLVGTMDSEASSSPVYFHPHQLCTVWVPCRLNREPSYAHKSYRQAQHAPAAWLAWNVPLCLRHIFPSNHNTDPPRQWDELCRPGTGAPIPAVISKRWRHVSNTISRHMQNFQCEIQCEPWPALSEWSARLQMVFFQKTSLVCSRSRMVAWRW